MSARLLKDCEGFHRRDFLKIGTGGLLGLSLPELLHLEAQAASRAQGEKRRATAVIVLWLAGGPSTIDMWDMKPDCASENRSGTTFRADFRKTRPVDSQAIRRAACLMAFQNLSCRSGYLSRCSGLK